MKHEKAVMASVFFLLGMIVGFVLAYQSPAKKFNPNINMIDRMAQQDAEMEM